MLYSRPVAELTWVGPLSMPAPRAGQAFPKERPAPAVLFLESGEQDYWPVYPVDRVLTVYRLEGGGSGLPRSWPLPGRHPSLSCWPSRSTGTPSSSSLGPTPGSGLAQRAQRPAGRALRPSAFASNPRHPAQEQIHSRPGLRRAG